jgi:proline dehydrogenase
LVLPQAKTTGELIRSLLVFKACEFRPLVTHADAILSWSKRIFGSTLVNWGIRNTFYHQFVAGEDAEGIKPTLSRLQSSGIDPILDYAVEEEEEAVKSREPPTSTVVARTYSYEGERLCNARMSTFLRAIDAATVAEGCGFAAVKVTALGPPTLLERTSTAMLVIKDLFRRFDRDGDGFVGREEFATVYAELFNDSSKERIDETFALLDVEQRDSRGIDYISWVRSVSVRDTASIARRCRTPGSISRAALDEEVGTVSFLSFFLKSA